MYHNYYGNEKINSRRYQYMYIYLGGESRLAHIN